MIFLGLLNSTPAQGTNPNVQLNGQIEGAGNSMLYIGRVSEYFMNFSIIDSFTCRNDTFSYETNFQRNSNLFCIQDINGQFLYFIPDSDRITFNGNWNELFLTFISGSETNLLLSDYWQSSSSKGKQLNLLYSSLFKAKEENDSIKMQTIKLRLDSLNAVKRAFPEDFVKENSQNMASAAILYLHLTLFRTDISKLKSMYSNLDKYVQESPSGVKVKEFITSLEACGVGKPFIDFGLITNENKIKSISSLKGRYFLIEFWTTWCGPCRAEWPFLLKAYEKYHMKGFEILSISLDHSKEKWMNEIEKQKAPWIQTTILNEDKYKKYDPFESDIAKAYSVLYLPSNYLIDPDGVIIASDLTRNALLDKLGEIYKE